MDESLEKSKYALCVNETEADGKVKSVRCRGRELKYLGSVIQHNRVR